MFLKISLKNIIIVLIILLFLVIFSVLFNVKYDFSQVYNKYIPSYEKKYNELRENYELMKENYTFIPGEIINISSSKIPSIFYINKGKNSGVKEGSYVVNNEGLVGVIVKTYKNYSIAKSVFSKRNNIAIEINDCFGTLNNGFISDLINCNDVSINDSIFTSKYSFSSSNILVGYVKKIKNDKIYINYAINPYKVKFIGIIYDSY